MFGQDISSRSLEVLWVNFHQEKEWLFGLKSHNFEDFWWERGLDKIFTCLVIFSQMQHYGIQKKSHFQAPFQLFFQYISFPHTDEGIFEIQTPLEQLLGFLNYAIQTDNSSDSLWYRLMYFWVSQLFLLSNFWFIHIFDSLNSSHISGHMTHTTWNVHKTMWKPWSKR